MVTKKRIGKAKMSSNPKRYEVQWNKVDSSGNRARKKYTEDTIRHLTTSSKFAHCPNTTFLPKNFCTVLYWFPKGAKKFFDYDSSLVKTQVSLESQKQTNWS